jgi:GxxExxY protein
MSGQFSLSYRGYDFSIAERILKACIEVHRMLGPGFEESIYQRALELEFAAAGLEFQRDVEVAVYYKGQAIGARFVDFVVEGCLLEIKATSALSPDDYVKAESCIKAASYPVGLLVNFGSLKIEIKRLANHSGGKHNGVS